MSLESIRNQESLDRNSDSRYPLGSWATAKDLTGQFEIPNDLIVAIYLGIPIDLQLLVTSCFISRISHTPNLLSLIISGSIAGEIREIARTDVSLVAAAAQIQQAGYAVGLIDGAGVYSDIRGRISLANLENLRLQPVGVYSFDATGAGVDVDAVRPSIRHVSAIEIESPDGGFARLNGPIRLRSGSNTRLRVETEAGEPVIYIDALDVSGLNEQLECEEGDARYVQRINGLKGNSQGEILLGASRCQQITASGNSIALRNNCSEPCAGCEEAEAVKLVVDPMSEQVSTLVSFITRLQVAVDGQSMSVALSQGPLQCKNEATTTTAAP